MSQVNLSRNIAMTNVPKQQIIGTILDGMSKKHDKLAEASFKSSSGEKFNDFSSLFDEGLLQQYIGITKDLSEAGNYSTQNNVTATKIDSIDSQLKKILEGTEQALTTLTGANGAVVDSINLPQIITAKLEELKAALNFRFNGKSLFSGFDTNQDAVGDIVNYSNIVDGKPTQNYAIASQESVEFNVSESQKIVYNIVAGEEAFANIIGGYHFALAGNTDKAMSHLRKGFDMLIDVRSKVQNNAKILHDTNQNIELTTLKLQSDYSELFSINQAEANFMAKEIQVSLRNSFWNLNLLNSLNILEHLGK